MTPRIPQTIQIWHALLKQQNVKGLDDLLADDVIFYSPVVFAPQHGKSITKLYLAAAFHVLAGDKFRYVREIYGDRDAVLEFETEIDGIVINGIDLIKWNDDYQIVEFKVMVRPLKAVNKIHQGMAAMLAQMEKK